MGADAMGNKYYENLVDYPFGQHRWVEPSDIHNFDSAMIPPEWHGWMTSMNDIPPSREEEYLSNAKQNIQPICDSDAPFDHGVGYQNNLFNFHHMHNQTSVRSRGYGIGNPVVGLPPGAPDAYYTQPGSPYNPASRKPFTFVGDLDEGKGENAKRRRYKSDKWADRLRTPEERVTYQNQFVEEQKKALEEAMANVELYRVKKLRARGSGTVIGGN